MAVEIKTVYISGIVAGRKYDCQPIQVPSDFPEGWPYVAEAPDPALKYPAYDWNHHEWIDQDAASQGQLLTSLSDTVKQVQGQVSDLTKKQTADVENVTNTAEASSKKIDQLIQLVTMQSGQVGQLGAAINQMSTALNKMSGNSTGNTNAGTDANKGGSN